MRKAEYVRSNWTQESNNGVLPSYNTNASTCKFFFTQHLFSPCYFQILLGNEELSNNTCFLPRRLNTNKDRLLSVYRMKFSVNFIWFELAYSIHISGDTFQN